MGDSNPAWPVLKAGSSTWSCSDLFATQSRAKSHTLPVLFWALFSPTPLAELAVVSQIFSQADPQKTGIFTGDISQWNIGMWLPKTPPPTPFPPLTARDKARLHITSNPWTHLWVVRVSFFLYTLGAYYCLNQAKRLVISSSSLRFEKGNS